jgi:hypothetical protein
MSTTALVTADELLAMPTGLGERYELVAPGFSCPVDELFR